MGQARSKVKSATVTEVDTGYENGGIVYDVEYEMTIHAKLGKILEYDADRDD